jgi:beta-mannosidase
MKNPAIIILLICNLQAWAYSGTRLNLTWETGYSRNAEIAPSKWVPSKVPGAVQLDIARAEKYASLYYAEHWKDYLWMEDMYFTYRTTFKKPEMDKNSRLYFRSLGIDYEFEIYFNDEKIFYQEGMFTPVTLDLTGRLNENNILLVKIFPVPKIKGAPVNARQAAQSVKPPVSYGWDWHPRLIPLGIWDDTFIQIEPSARVEDISPDYVLNEELARADIDLKIKGRNLRGMRYSWILSDASGREMLKTTGIFDSDQKEVPLVLDKPSLWWPHDHGVPYLYTYQLRLTDDSGMQIQETGSRIGFRRVRLVMNDGAWREPAGFPKSRSVPPVQFEINGRKIFCKGTNWVPPEIFPGIITRERYARLLDFAKEANFNILRVWGGGIVNKESFYELCDEKGILVWTEFPLAGNNYEGTPHYLSILEKESASIINRIKKHPSLALWCGGNELFNAWSGMTDQSLALRLLNSQCYRLDPETPFLNTSPVMGMGHGYYIFRNQTTGEEVYQLMARSKFTAYTEFGMPAPASVEILKKIIPPGELWPPRPGTSWESHHAYKAWAGDTWLCQDIIDDYFGKSDSLAELVSNGQLHSPVENLHIYRYKYAYVPQISGQVPIRTKEDNSPSKLSFPLKGK